MNESEFQQLRGSSWRRRLTAAEEARLQEYFLLHPDAQVDWESDATVSQLLSQLPDAPIASNFTAQVMQAVDRDIRLAERATEYHPSLWQWLHRWAPRAAWTSLALSGVFLAYAQYQNFSRAQFAKGVAQVSRMAALPNLEMFEDFEAIHRISQVTPDDSEVLAALK